MEIKTEEGIIISETNYSETSKILNIFTRSGIYGLIAKGARRPKSKFASFTSKMTRSEFTFYYKEGKISNVIEIAPLQGLKNIYKDLKALSYASYVTELLSKVYEQNKDSHLYDLLMDALFKIEEGLDPKGISMICEVKSFAYLGVDMHLDACLCGSKDIKTFSIDEASFICKDCYNGEKIFSMKALACLKLFKNVNLKELNKLNIDDVTKRELDEIIYAYLETYTGLYLKSRNFLNQLLV